MKTEKSRSKERDTDRKVPLRVAAFLLCTITESLRYIIYFILNSEYKFSVVETSDLKFLFSCQLFGKDRKYYTEKEQTTKVATPRIRIAIVCVMITVIIVGEDVTIAWKWIQISNEILPVIFIYLLSIISPYHFNIEITLLLILNKYKILWN